jgi:hypothetical protein
LQSVCLCVAEGYGFTSHKFDVSVGAVVDAAAGSHDADGTNIMANGNSKNDVGV